MCLNLATICSSFLRTRTRGSLLLLRPLFEKERFSCLSRQSTSERHVRGQREVLPGMALQVPACPSIWGLAVRPGGAAAARPGHPQLPLYFCRDEESFYTRARVAGRTSSRGGWPTPCGCCGAVQDHSLGSRRMHVFFL